MEDIHGLPNKSLRKGILSFLILNCLNTQPGYPYALLKRLEKLKHPIIRGLTKSDLYNIMNTFEKNELVKSNVVVKGSKVQKYYELTAKGKDTLRATRKVLFGALSQVKSLTKAG